MFVTLAAWAMIFYTRCNYRVPDVPLPQLLRSILGLQSATSAIACRQQAFRLGAHPTGVSATHCYTFVSRGLLTQTHVTYAIFNAC